MNKLREGIFERIRENRISLKHSKVKLLEFGSDSFTSTLETGPTVVYHSAMPEASLGEIYFIVFMMVLVLIISTVSLYIFVKTYKKEMREREKEKRGTQPDDAVEPSSEENK